VGPGSTHRPEPNWACTSSALRAGGSPLRLALVETSAPPNAAHSAPAMGCAVTRTATLGCAPVIQREAAAPAGNTQVCGPGQLARARASAAGSGTSM
jgi:hypothetical protein